MTRREPTAAWARLGALISCACLIGLTLPGTALAARVALVIGNDSYLRVTPLRNARTDAQSIAAVLGKAGFKVDLKLDVRFTEMQAAVRDFKARVAEGDEVVVFFSGHGVQLDAANYLLPTDIRGETPEQVRDEAIALQRILDDLSQRKAKVSLIIIDACRDNPFKGQAAGRSIGTTRGLAAAASNSDQMVLYSAGSGQQALDRLSGTDPSRNGLFTRVLLQEISQPGVPVREVLQSVRQKVAAMAQSVGQKQVPAIYDEALSEMVIMPGARSAVAANRPAAGTAATAAPTPTPTIAPGGVASAPGQSFSECSGCPEMVVVPSGKFLVASNEPGAGAAAAKEFAVPYALAVGKYEVSFDEWDACQADRGCSTRPSDEGWGRGAQPVINVSLEDARQYAAWLSRKTGARYRLLHEAEWEYAAAGGSTAAYPWGPSIGNGNANCSGCGAGASERKYPLPVGKFGPNRFGLYDVIGNAWEWTDDCYEPAMRKLLADDKSPSPACSSAVARGGSFMTSSTEATLQRRREVAPDIQSKQNGFRIARELP